MKILKDKKQLFNALIFAVCTLIILFQNQFITNRLITILLIIISVFGIIYSVYNSEIKKLPKTIIIALYILFLIIYFVIEFL